MNDGRSTAAWSNFLDALNALVLVAYGRAQPDRIGAAEERVKDAAVALPIDRAVEAALQRLDAATDRLVAAATRATADNPPR